ncbi:hypothetical protein [Haladaptatus sp. NG-WS-4]
MSDSTSGIVSLNRSTVTVAPGETEAFELTVDADNGGGTYSGRLSFDDGKYTSIFGFVKAYEVTIRKDGIGRTNTENDLVRLLSEDGWEVVDPVQCVSNGTATYYVYGTGDYHAVLSGINEDDGQPVVVSETFTVSHDRTFVLDESNTVEFGLDTTAAEIDHGRLLTRNVELDFTKRTWLDDYRGGITAPFPRQCRRPAIGVGRTSLDTRKRRQW